MGPDPDHAGVGKREASAGCENFLPRGLTLAENARVELYNFIRGTLAWAASVALLWPANVPLMALAYKVRNGPNPIPMPAKEFWTRAGCASFLVAILTLVLIAVDYLVIEGTDLPAGPIHLVILACYVPAGMWVLFVFFALEDLMQATSVFAIYLCLPMLVLYVLNAVVQFWQPLVDLVQVWLKAPS